MKIGHYFWGCGDMEGQNPNVQRLCPTWDEEREYLRSHCRFEVFDNFGRKIKKRTSDQRTERVDGMYNFSIYFIDSEDRLCVHYAS